MSKTHYGTGIYAHILSLYYPNQTVLSLSGRTCLPAKNPFNADKSTLNIFVEKELVLGNVLDKEFVLHSDSEISCQRVQSTSSLVTMPSAAEIACHYDTQNAIPAGDAFDFAELHYKQSGEELLQILNKEMNLHIGEKFDFHKNRNSNTEIQNQGNHTNQINHSSDNGEVFFSFFKAPVSNTKPSKAVSLLHIYNSIKGEYYKDRTEILRAISDVQQARKFKAAKFDYCTFSGIFSIRSDKALIQHSNMICVDFDHVQNVDMLRSQLLQDDYFDTLLLFRSPSGDGLKWIIPIDVTQATHANYFVAIANYIQQTYSVEVDKSGRDISRACFLPHDPHAYINPLFLNSFNS